MLARASILPEKRALLQGERLRVSAAPEMSDISELAGSETGAAEGSPSRRVPDNLKMLTKFSQGFSEEINPRN